MLVVGWRRGREEKGEGQEGWRPGSLRVSLGEIGAQSKLRGGDMGAVRWLRLAADRAFTGRALHRENAWRDSKMQQKSPGCFP